MVMAMAMGDGRPAGLDDEQWTIFAPAAAAGDEPADEPCDDACPVVPDDVWAARPVLGAIRDWARWRCAAPDAVLAACLARAAIAAWGIPRVLVHSRGDRGDPTHAGVFVACIGPSGCGKTTAVRAARAAVPPDDAATDVRWDLPIGTGEGLAEAYITEVETPPPPGASRGAKPTRERMQTVQRALFICDEGETLARLLVREGATLGAALRSGFSGEPLGATNAHRDRQRRVVDYALSVIICATPGAAAAIAAHVESGLPQRMLWASAVDPSAPRRPARAEPPALDRMRGDITFSRAILSEMADDAYEIRTGRRVVEPMDQHLPIIRCRVAAILAAWDQRAEVTDDDWQIAGAIVATSCAARNHALRQAAIATADERARIAVERGEIAQVCRAMTDQTPAAIERIAARIWRHIATHGPASRRQLRDRCVKRHERHLIAPAVTMALASGWLAETLGGTLGHGECTP